MSIDPEYKKFPFKTPYNAFSNNPIIFIDPDGSTDYYNLNGKKIGTDGKKNGLIGVVHDKDIAKGIKKGTSKLAENPLNGQKFDGGFIIHKDVLNSTEKVANKAYSEKGKNREFGASLTKDGENFKSSAIFEGPPVNLDDKELLSAGVKIPGGNVSIHSHPTGFGKEKSFKGAPSLKNQVGVGETSDEETLFPNYDMNIVIGNEKYTTTVVLQGQTVPTHGENQINIYGNSVDKKIGTITTGILGKINKSIRKGEKK